MELTQWDDEGDEIIDESPEYSPKSDFSKAMVVKEAVSKCMDARAQEMKAGHWNIKVFPNGVQKEYKSDTRKQYIATVEALRNLMSPEIQRHDKFKVVEKKIRAEMIKIFNLYVYEEKRITMVKTPNGNMPMWKNTGRKFMPDVDDVVTVPGGGRQGNTGPGLWNSYVNVYWNNMVLEYDRLFAGLNDLIDSLNYFKQELVYG